MNVTNGEAILNDFVSSLLLAKGKEDEPKAHADLFERVNEKINRAILEALPADQLDYIENIIDDGTITEEKVTNTLEGSEIDEEEIVSRAMIEFKNEYLGDEK